MWCLRLRTAIAATGLGGSASSAAAAAAAALPLTAIHSRGFAAKKPVIRFGQIISPRPPPSPPPPPPAPPSVRRKRLTPPPQDDRKRGAELIAAPALRSVLSPRRAVNAATATTTTTTTASGSDVDVSGSALYSTNFRALGCSDEIVQALTESLRIGAATEIQSLAIPHILSGRDTVIASQTGTGKTLTFLLPIIQQLRRDERAHPIPSAPPAPPASPAAPRSKQSTSPVAAAAIVSDPKSEIRSPAKPKHPRAVRTSSLQARQPTSTQPEMN